LRHQRFELRAAHLARRKTRGEKEQKKPAATEAEIYVNNRNGFGARRASHCGGNWRTHLFARGFVGFAAGY
jgi:hypothetical protein